MSSDDFLTLTSSESIFVISSISVVPKKSKKGVPTKVIQKLLRHGRASITEDIYIDIDNTSDFVKQELNRVFAT